MLVKKIAVLFSGTGSNLEQILLHVHQKEFQHCRIEVALALCNRHDAPGIHIARNHGIEPLIVDHTRFASREAFDTALVEAIEQSGACLSVLAGFMRILSPLFTSRIRAINLHPSLLPLFKGANAIHESYHSGMKVAGVSVHYVSSELDGGEIIAQRCFAIVEGMDFDAFKVHIHALEHALLPQTIVQLLDTPLHHP